MDDFVPCFMCLFASCNICVNSNKSYLKIKKNRKLYETWEQMRLSNWETCLQRWRFSQILCICYSSHYHLPRKQEPWPSGQPGRRPYREHWSSGSWVRGELGMCQVGWDRVHVPFSREPYPQGIPMLLGKQPAPRTCPGGRKAANKGDTHFIYPQVKDQTIEAQKGKWLSQILGWDQNFIFQYQTVDQKTALSKLWAKSQHAASSEPREDLRAHIECDLTHQQVFTY
jgi:hypothetical protein